MNVDILTLSKPTRCPVNVRMHHAFISDAMSVRNNPPALSRLRIAARERDKWAILQHSVGVSHEN